MIRQLNKQFEIARHVSFISGAGGLPMINIQTDVATATMSLYGGQLLQFQKVDEQPIIWLSERSHYQKNKAIRGGIPICWPWFGAHETDKNQPAHGYARIRMWQVDDVYLEEQAVNIHISLPLQDQECVVSQLKYKIADDLTVALETINQSNENIEISSALHSYYQVGDITKIGIKGLAEKQYIDKTQLNKIGIQDSPLVITCETDRIYLDTTGMIIIQDPVLNRSIQIKKTGSNSTVVWNPWADKSMSMTDMPDNGWQTMVCVEAANVGSDARFLAPGEHHCLQNIISTQ